MREINSKVSDRRETRDQTRVWSGVKFYIRTTTTKSFQTFRRDDKQWSNSSNFAQVVPSEKQYSRFSEDLCFFHFSTGNQAKCTQVLSASFKRYS